MSLAWSLGAAESQPGPLSAHQIHIEWPYLTYIVHHNRAQQPRWRQVTRLTFSPQIVIQGDSWVSGRDNLRPQRFVRCAGRVLEVVLSRSPVDSHVAARRTRILRLLCAKQSASGPSVGWSTIQHQHPWRYGTVTVLHRSTQRISWGISCAIAQQVGSIQPRSLAPDGNCCHCSICEQFCLHHHDDRHLVQRRCSYPLLPFLLSTPRLLC